jgi:hypothetical protein
VDLEHASISLGILFGILGTIFGPVATVVAWLGRAAYKAEKNLLELRLQGMTGASDKAFAEAATARTECKQLTERVVELEKRHIAIDGRLLGIDSTAHQAIDGIESMREKMVSKEYLAGEFRTQNVTLTHQNQALADIKSELSRKVSVGAMPATRVERHEPPSDRPFVRRDR